MGNGTTSTTTSTGDQVSLPLLQDLVDLVSSLPTTSDKASPGTEPAPIDNAAAAKDLKKLVNEIKGLGGLLDKDGNPSPEKAAEASQLLAKEAAARKDKDPRAAARLLQDAVAINPEDKDLRVQAGQAWVDWAAKQKDPAVAEVAAKTGLGFIQNIDTSKGQNPDIAKAKFELGRRTMAFCAANNNWPEAQTYLQLTIQNGTPDQVKELLQGFEDHPHPELFPMIPGKDLHQSPAQFFADTLVDAGRPQEARDVYLHEADRFKDSNPDLAEGMKFLADQIELDPAQAFADLGKWNDADNAKVDEDINALGYYKDPTKIDSAKGRIRAEVQHFLFSDEMKHVELGSPEYKQKMAKFLGTETEYQFLPIADKKDVMKTEYSVSQDPYQYKLELEDGDSNWNYLRCESDLDRKARYYKFAGDDMLGEGHSNAVIPPGTKYSDRVKSAIRLYQKSLDLQKEGDNDHGDTAGACRLQLARSYTLLAQGDVGPQLSKILFNEAAKQLGTLSSDRFSADWKTMQAAGDLCLASGHPGQARQYYMEALGLAQKEGVPDYVKTTVDYVHQLDFRQAYDGEQDFKNTPLGKGLQKATDAEAKQMVEDRHKQGDKIPTPGENLMDAILSDRGKPPDPVRKGVKPSEIVAWYKEARPGVEVSEDTLTAKNYVAYAMAHGDTFRGDLEQVYGKLPFNDKGELDPQFKKMAEQSHEDRTHKAEDLAKQHGLEPDSDAFKKFVHDEMIKKDPLDDAFQMLTSPLNNSDLSGAFYAINEIRGKTLEANAQLGLASGPEGAAQALEDFQQAGQAFANAYDLNRETQDLYSSAKGFYQAGQIAKLSGLDEESKALFDKGVQALQFGGTELLNDPQAMKLLGDGLMGEGKFAEARNAYNTAQEPLLQYYGARGVEPPPPEFYTQCALLSDQCNKAAYTQKELGSVLDEKAVLEEKFAKGPLSPTDKNRFEQIQKGQGLLEKIDGLHYPPKPVSSLSEDPDEPIAISKLRNDLIAALREGDSKKIEDLEAVVSRQVQNVATLQMADAMRRDAILPQLPPQVQDYIRRTNDWSILKVGEPDPSAASQTALTLGASIPGPYNEDNLPNKDWNAEALNNTPINKALVEWDKNNPEQAAKVRETLKLFGTNGLIYNLRDYQDLDTLNSKVDEIKGKLFQTDEKGELPLDSQDPTKQAHVYKPNSDIQAWFKDAKELDLRNKPEEWMSSHLQDTRGSLELTAKTEGALEAVKKDYQETKDGLDAAKQSGDTEKANALGQHLEELKGRITELRGNFGKTLQSQTDQFGTDLESFGKHSKTLKKLGEGDRYAYQPQLQAAQGKLQEAAKDFGAFGDDADPGAVLDAMIADTKQLAVAQGTLLKGITLVHLSCIQDFKPGYMADMTAMGGEEAKNKKPDMKELEANKPGWHSDPKWNAAISKINEGSLDVKDLDADKIEKFLAHNTEVLKEGDRDMFDDLPTTLSKGINAQVDQIRKFKQEKLEAGQTNTYEYDQLINSYLQAQKALDSGDTGRALALFKVATDSKRRSGVMKDFENLKEDEMMDNLFLEVGIVTAATLLTAGTMSLVAGGAVAAVAEGTAGTLTVIGTGLLEGAAFVTWDMTLRSYLSTTNHIGAATVQNPWEEIHGPEDLVWKIVMNAGMLKALHFAGEAFQGLTLGSRVLSRVGAETLMESASEAGLSSSLMRKLLQEEMENLGKGGESLLGKGLSKLGKGAYHLGSFGVEFGSMQAWSVLESSLDSLRHAAHGDKLAWSNLDDKISQIFDPQNLALSCAQLIGLKLGGFGTAPFIEAIQKSDLDVAQKEQFKSFFKIKEQFETDLTTAVDQAKAEGKPFVLSPELRGAAQKLMAAGQILDLPEPLAKQIEGVPEQVQAWRSMKRLLIQLDDYSGKIRRGEPGGDHYSGRGSEDGVNSEPIAPAKGTAPQGQPDVFFVGRGRSPALIVPSEQPEWKVKSVEKKGGGYEVTLTNLQDPKEELTAQCAKAPQIGIGTEVAVAGIGGGGSAIPDNLQPIRQRKATLRNDEALDKFLDTIRHSEPEPIVLDDADIISVEEGNGRKRLRQAAEGLRGKEDGSQRGLAEQFGAVDMFNDGTRSFLKRVAANPSLDVPAETRRMGEVLNYLNDSVLSQVDNLSPQQMQILRETLFRQVMDGNTTMEDAQVLGKQLKDGDSHLVILKPGEMADHPYAYHVEKGKAEPFQGDEGSLGIRDLQSQEYYQHLTRSDPEAAKDPQAKEAVEAFVDGLNKNEKYPEIVDGLRRGSLVLVLKDGKVEAKPLEEVPVTANQKDDFYSALQLENRGIENQPKVRRALDAFLEKNFDNAALAKAMLDNVQRGKILLTYANGEFYLQTKEAVADRIKTAGQSLDAFLQKNQAKYGKLDKRITAAVLESVARDPNFPVDEIGARFETTLQGLNAAREGIRDVPKDQQISTLEALTRALASGTIEPKDVEAASAKGLDPAGIKELEGKLGIERGQWLLELVKDPAGFKEKMRDSLAPEVDPAVVQEVVDNYGSVDKVPKFSDFDTGANTLMGMIQKPETAYDYQAQRKMLSALRYQFGTDPQYKARLAGLGNFIEVAKEKETACNSDFAVGSRVEPKFEDGRVMYVRVSQKEVNGEWVTSVNEVDPATYHAFLRYQTENQPLPQFALDSETKTLEPGPKFQDTHGNLWNTKEHADAWSKMIEAHGTSDQPISTQDYVNAYTEANGKAPEAKDIDFFNKKFNGKYLDQEGRAHDRRDARDAANGSEDVLPRFSLPGENPDPLPQFALDDDSQTVTSTPKFQDAHGNLWKSQERANAWSKLMARFASESAPVLTTKDYIQAYTEANGKPPNKADLAFFDKKFNGRFLDQNGHVQNSIEACQLVNQYGSLGVVPWYRTFEQGREAFLAKQNTPELALNFEAQRDSYNILKVLYGRDPAHQKDLQELSDALDSTWLKLRYKEDDFRSVVDMEIETNEHGETRYIQYVKYYDGDNLREVVTRVETGAADYYAYQRYLAKDPDRVRAHGELEAPPDPSQDLKNGFAFGQSIVLNLDTDQLELVDGEGETIRTATQDEYQQFANYQKDLNAKGFAQGQSVVLNADTHQFELLDRDGNAIRTVTQDVYEQFVDYQKDLNKTPPAPGQTIVLNIDTGQYELVGSDGNTIRALTRGEYERLTDDQTEDEEHHPRHNAVPPGAPSEAPPTFTARHLDQSNLGTDWERLGFVDTLLDERLNAKLKTEVGAAANDNIVGLDRYIGRELFNEVSRMPKFFQDKGYEKLSKAIQEDMDTVVHGDPESPEFDDAMERLTDLLYLRRNGGADRKNAYVQAGDLQLMSPELRQAFAEDAARIYEIETEYPPASARSDTANRGDEDWSDFDDAFQEPALPQAANQGPASSGLPSAMGSNQSNYCVVGSGKNPAVILRSEKGEWKVKAIEQEQDGKWKVTLSNIENPSEELSAANFQIEPDFKVDSQVNVVTIGMMGGGRAPTLVVPSEKSEWKVGSIEEGGGRWFVTFTNSQDPQWQQFVTFTNPPRFKVGDGMGLIGIGGGGSAGIVPPAVSGPLPVGQVRSLSVPADGSKFTIGRDPNSNLRFDDNRISRTHVTILWSAEEGCFYVADGAMGTKDRSLNGVLVNGAPIPPGQKFVKVPANQGQSNYIFLSGAQFKLEVPSTPVVGVQVHSRGFLTTKVDGQDYALRKQGLNDTNISAPGEIHARIREARISETDSQGRIALRLDTYRWGDPAAQKGELYLMVTQSEAAALGLKVNPDGSIDPSQNRDEIVFRYFNEKDLRAPQMNAAPLSTSSDGPPAVQILPPLPPAPKAKPILFQDSNGSNYQLRASSPEQRMDGTSNVGTVLSFKPIPGDRRGDFQMVVLVQEGLAPDSPMQTVTFKVHPSKARELGLKVDRNGRLTPDSPKGLLVSSLHVPVQVNGRKFVFQALDPNLVDYVQSQEATGNPMPMTGRIERVNSVPGKPDQVVVHVSYSLSGFGDLRRTSIPMSRQEATKLGVRFLTKGMYDVDEPMLIELKPGGPVEMPDYDLDGPLPEGVNAIIQDNEPEQPRRGRIDVDHATPRYGTASGQTNEGIGYKEKNEDAIVQGDNWAAVVDGMGGHGAGDKASEIVSKALAQYLHAHRNDPDPKQVLHDALVYAGDAVNASPYGKNSKAGAVAVVHMVVTNPDGSQKIIVGHVGDAGALVIGKDGKVKYQTSDQGPAGFMMQREIKQGKSHDDAETGKRANPSANIVGACLGAGHEADPIVREFPLEDGDRVVMYSDGLGDAMSSIEITNRIMRAKTAKAAEEDIFNTGLGNMADLSDALGELRPGKRLPITKDGYIDAQGNIYDLPEGGKVVGQLKAGDPSWETVQEHYGTIPIGERKPYPRTAYVDGSGDIYDALTGGNLIDHYKNDNLAVHVYFHDPKGKNEDLDLDSPTKKMQPDEVWIEHRPSNAPKGTPLLDSKGNVVPPDQDIDFQTIPESGRVTEDDLATLVKLDQRPVVTEILNDPQLRPVSKVAVDGQTFYLSRVIETTHEGEGMRPHVLALVPVQEGGRTVLKRRFFYKSNSDGGWRASPYMIGGQYSKGEGIHYTQETQPIPELNQAFQDLENAGEKIPKVRLPLEEFRNYIDAGSPLLDLDAKVSIIGGFGNEILFPPNAGMTNIGALQPAKAFRAGGGNRSQDPTLIPTLSKLTYPEGFIPDFQKPPTKTFEEMHTLLGPITCRDYEGGYLIEKGTGRKRPVIWTMAEDGEGRTWVKSIRYTDSKITSYGVYNEVIDSGIITSKPLEYAQQSERLPAEYHPQFDNTYDDITPALNFLKPIREYRASRGLANPELPSEAPKRYLPPSAPPMPSPKALDPVDAYANHNLAIVGGDFSDRANVKTVNNLSPNFRNQVNAQGFIEVPVYINPRLGLIRAVGGLQGTDYYDSLQYRKVTLLLKPAGEGGGPYRGSGNENGPLVIQKVVFPPDIVDFNVTSALADLQGKEFRVEPAANAEPSGGSPGVVVTSTLRGLSGTGNQWVYQMPADLPLAFLGREALMGQAGSDQVSADHARIWRSGGATWIEDSSSLNGTEVVRNGKTVWYSRGRKDPMKSNFVLQPGDKIVLGKMVEVEFR